MKKLILIFAFLLTFGVNAFGQEPQPTLEPTVVIKQSTADACADAFTERKALRDELAVKTQAIADLKEEITRLKIELSKLTGEKNGADAMVIRLTAITDLLLKSVRPKKIGVIVF